MQRVAPGVVEQPGHGPARQVTSAERPRHRHQLAGAQTTQPQASDPVIPPGETAPPLAQLAGPGRYQPQHPVSLHPPQGKKKRPGRGLIAPVQVVDHHHDDPVAILKVAENCHQLRTDGHRVGVFPPRRCGPRGSFRGRRPGTGQELVGESPG
jgi:hypothetical protein